MNGHPRRAEPWKSSSSESLSSESSSDSSKPSSDCESSPSSDSAVRPIRSSSSDSSEPAASASSSSSSLDSESKSTRCRDGVPHLLHRPPSTTPRWHSRHSVRRSHRRGLTASTTRLPAFLHVGSGRATVLVSVLAALRLRCLRAATLRRMAAAASRCASVSGSSSCTAATISAHVSGSNSAAMLSSRSGVRWNTATASASESTSPPRRRTPCGPSLLIHSRTTLDALLTRWSPGLSVHASRYVMPRWTTAYIR
mmetsp:Transcript_35592/g.93058  ORF Transcript_35592/g.93058 Transcript_35592/m.93058 type:complete len:254 (-) Transcript_35592:523-1284(-)